MHTQHFSVEEAQAQIEALRDVLTKMAGLKERLDARGFDVHRAEYPAGRSPNGKEYYPEEFHELMRLVKRVAEQGIKIKDLGAGLVDFPHLRENGEEVYLCWKLGEGEIGYWHRLEDGFSGRQPLTAL